MFRWHTILLVKLEASKPDGKQGGHVQESLFPASWQMLTAPCAKRAALNRYNAECCLTGVGNSTLLPAYDVPPKLS